MNITEIPVEGYERVVRARDRELGLFAFIAVHDTTLGPALGGLRMWDFPDEPTALTDVLRLAEGMTHKSAMAETGLGGGKAVIIGNPDTGKSREKFLAMGEFIDSLGGMYITAEDVGTSVADMQIIRERTRHVTGLPRAQGSSGDPSPFTARGVFLGLLAAAKRVLNLPPDQTDLPAVRVAVQGLGSVGRSLVGHLLEAGAEVYASDLNPDRVAAFMESHPEVHFVGHEEIYDTGADIFSPNALGGILNQSTIPRLRVKAIAGAANNQLLTEADGERLQEQGILYAPDFIINAGGIINIAVELSGVGYSEDEARRRVEAIPRALEDVFDMAEDRGWPTFRAALAAAEERLEAARSAGQIRSGGR